MKQAGAELGQAQVKLDDIVVVVVKVVVKAMVEVVVGQNEINTNLNFS